MALQPEYNYIYRIGLYLRKIVFLDVYYNAHRNARN